MIRLLFFVPLLFSKNATYELNPSVDPCENFYDYTCSKTIDSFTLRQDRSRHNFSIDDIEENLLNEKKKFIAKTPVKNHRTENIKNLFLSCLNEKEKAKYEKEYTTSTLRFIKTIPSLEKFLDFLSSQLIRGEEHSVIEFGRLPNLDSSDQNDLYLLTDWLSLPERSYYEKEDLLHDFIGVVKAFFDALKEPKSQERAESIVQFQIDASKSFPLPVEIRDRISQKSSVTREEIEKKWPNLKLSSFLSKIPKETLIRNLSPENFTWFQDNIPKIPFQVLKDAYLFLLLSPSMDSAYSNYFKIKFDFNHKYLGGPEKRESKEEECTKFVMNRYGMELDHELLPKLFPNFDEAKVRKVVEGIRNSYLSGLYAAEWLSPGAKKNAIEKIQKAKLHLIKPTRDEDWNFRIDTTYSKNSYYDNVRKLNKLSHEKSISRFGKKRNADEWEMGPLTANAGYNPADNKFVLPIGILQPPFYDSKYSEEAAYGGIGAVIGHELGHAVDDKGSKFNANGQLVRWMTDEDLSTFNSKVDSLKKELEANELPQHLKIGEYIGDLTGLQMSYDAAFPKGVGTVAKKKEFFLHYGKLWCEVARPEFKELLKKVDPHPPGFFRINSVVKQLKGFQEAFSCKEGSKMTMKDSDRVRVW